ncbi:MAG: thioredoxin family protein [Spirosomaceae bacterium]|jgi:thiol:disulfide interchange protein|nr:thioredoxin family protein [Spirosomataceae bacterium]
MRKLILATILLSTFFISCSRQVVKMNFIKEKDRDFEQILALAKQQNKMVFVDVYTTWCGPCKWMDENVFSDARVAEKFNKKFINYKIDGESFEGVNVVIKYSVGAYPTYIFVKPDGTPLHRIEGMMGVEGLIQEADFAANLLRKQ